jgi:ABC-type nickel/cobalt efflux system permease component RcnA
MLDPALALFAGAIGLGLVHGAEPGHGWPIAATYALDRPNKWRNGLLASTLLGLGHLVSSLAVVALFFLARSYFELTQINEPLTVGPVAIGGPVDVVAGVLLLALAVREYRHGHDHSMGDGNGADTDDGHDHHDHESGHHDDGHGHGDDEQNHHHDGHQHDDESHSHDHLSTDDLDQKGLTGIVWTAFVLGFAHEEEFEIIGLCLGSALCLELMVVYAAAVLLALVGLTMALIAGYERYEDRVEGLTQYFPTISAAILALLGVGFVLGLV